MEDVIPPSAPTDGGVRVMLVDVHDATRSGLRALLDRHGDIEVVAEAASFTTALTEAFRCRPHVVVMDLVLSDGSAIEAIREMTARHPEVRVLVLAAYADDETVLAGVAAGAADVVLKESGGRHVVGAIRRSAGPSPGG